MSNFFDQSIKVILKHEGGLVNNPNDPGGITVYGISLRFLQAHNIDITGDGHVDADDIKALLKDPAKAIKIYHDQIWDDGKYDRFDNYWVCTKIFDMDVNMGQKQAWILAQRAANVCGCGLAEDGSLGPKSLAAINALDPVQFIGALQTAQKQFYYDLVQRKPKLSEFLEGWLKRSCWPEQM